MSSQSSGRYFLCDLFFSIIVFHGAFICTFASPVFFPRHDVAVFAKIFYDLPNTFAGLAVHFEYGPAACKLEPSPCLRQVGIWTVDMGYDADNVPVTYRSHSGREK